MSKDNLIDYFTSLRDYYGKYHKHKEVSAWASLVLHILFCTVAIRFQLSNPSKCIAFIILVIGVLSVALLVFCYIKNQLKMKDKGGSYAAAANYFLSEILCMEDIDVKCEQYVSQPKETGNTTSQAEHVLPESVIKKATVLNTRGTGFRDRTRWLTYGLLFISTTLVIVLKAIEAFY